MLSEIKCPEICMVDSLRLLKKNESVTIIYENAKYGKKYGYHETL